MMPNESAIDPRANFSRISKLLKIFDKYLIQLIIILSLFSFYITAIVLTVLKIIFGKKETTKNLYTKSAIIFMVISCLFLLLAFEIETSSNYLVSYYDDNKYNYEPLTDNFQILMSNLLPWWTTMIQIISQYITIPGADNFSTAIILLIILGIFQKVKTKNANIFIHSGVYARIMAITRLIRVVAFSLVLIPNPKLNCYLEKFRVPEDNYQMFWDMIKFRNAGCNDLVISGHTLFIWITYKFISRIMGRCTAAYLNLIVPFILFNIVMMKNHYSVDVFLGLIIADYIWGIVMAKYEKLISEYSVDNDEYIDRNRIVNSIEKNDKLEIDLSFERI